MKNKRFLGLVLTAHVVIAGALIVQPGCQTTQPHKTPVPSARPADEAPLAQGAPRPVNPAFNGGMGDRQTPMRPESADYGSSDEPGSILEPLGNKGSDTLLTPVPEAITYIVTKGDTLSRIAKKNGVSVAAIKAANSLKGDTIRIGQELVIPGTSAAPATDKQSPSAIGPGTEYIVVSGDSLSRIAKKHGVSVNDIKAANNLTKDIIRIGQKLVVPAAGVAPKVAPASSVAPIDSGDSYTVKPGDTLGSIAKRAGVKIPDLMDLNGISDPRKLAAGQVLKMPNGSNMSASSTPSTPPSSASRAAATPGMDGPPAPIVVKPAPLSDSNASDANSLEFLDDEPATPTVPVQMDEAEPEPLP